MTLIKCPECDGTGKIECECDNLEKLHTLYNENYTYSGEYRGIEQCKDCGQLFEVRKKWHDGSGKDEEYNKITLKDAFMLITKWK